MSIQTLSIAPTNTSTATFRAWGSAISAALAAAGLVQTADTGQINWATVTAPASPNVQSGYEIWRFSDSLQASAPVFVRIDYGSGGFNASNPQIWLTVGTATNGAGTITANVSFPGSTLAQVACAYAGASNQWATASAANLWVDSDAGSSLMIAGWVNPPGTGFAAASGLFGLVERSRNWDGTPNSNGVCVYTEGLNATNAAVMGQIVIAQATTYNGAGSTTPPIISGFNQVPTGTRSMAEGSTLYLIPVPTGFTPHMNAPSKHLVAAFKNDLPGNTQFQIQSYGVAHTFNSTGPTNANVPTPESTGILQYCWRVA